MRKSVPGPWFPDPRLVAMCLVQEGQQQRLAALVQALSGMRLCVCACVCVCEREREREVNAQGPVDMGASYDGHW